MRPGWFYRRSEDRLVKSLRQLMDIYYSSVGRNAALLLNLTPDQRGLIPELDAQRAKEFGGRIRATFATNLLVGARVAASNVNRQDAQTGPDKLTDGDLRTYWQPEDWSGPVELAFTLEKPVTFNRIMLQENIALGQRIERFGVDAWIETGWREIEGGTTVGYKRSLRLRSAVTTDRLRVRIPEARVSATLAEVGAYWEPWLDSGGFPWKSRWQPRSIGAFSQMRASSYPGRFRRPFWRTRTLIRIQTCETLFVVARPQTGSCLSSVSFSY